jgi:hypothetical protein
MLHELTRQLRGLCNEQSDLVGEWTRPDVTQVTGCVAHRVSGRGEVAGAGNKGTPAAHDDVLAGRRVLDKRANLYRMCRVGHIRNVRFGISSNR